MSSSGARELAHRANLNYDRSHTLDPHNFARMMELVLIRDGLIRRAFILHQGLATLVSCAATACQRPSRMCQTSV